MINLKRKVSEIVVNEGRRPVDQGHAESLAKSMKENGLINPISIDKCNVLIAGAHRLEAAKILGWDEIECTVMDVDAVHAELAEIDENLIRRNLDSIDEGNKLLRRKELYEMIHPETKAGTAGANATNQKRWGIATEEFSAATEKSFVDDTAEKMGITPRSVRNLIQTARDLTPETKEVVKQNKISAEQSLFLSRIKDPAQQLSAAQKLASHEIKSVEELKPKPKPPEPPLPPVRTLEETIRAMKEPSGAFELTPELLLDEFSSVVSSFVKRLDEFTTDEYASVYSHFSTKDKDKLQYLMSAMKSKIDTVYNFQKGRFQ